MAWWVWCWNQTGCLCECATVRVVVGDPAETLDRLRVIRDRMEKLDRDYWERERRRKARKIRKLLKAAKSRELKGQR